MKQETRRIKSRKRKQQKMLLFIIEICCIICMFSLIAFIIGKVMGSKGENGKQETRQVVVNETEVVYQAVTDEVQSNSVDEDVLHKDILLVNKENKLPDDYEVDLVTLEDGVNRGAKVAYEPLCNMLRAGRKEGLVFEICSAYRSVERQRELFDEDVDALVRKGYSYSRAYEEVAKETMPPGYSEHSTGLAFDIVAYNYQMLDEGQEDTAENKWLREHCAEYGFILRYPKEKEEVTKINYESWHFRYVGVDVAKYIMENNLTLEEYLEL